MSNTSALLINQVRIRLFEESVPRIKKCLNELTEDEVWQQPNDNLSSIGNLVLHLCGNVTQWIGTGLGNQPDNRQRDKEFMPQSSIPKAQLVAKLDALEMNTLTVLNELTEAQLLATHTVQGFTETGVSILVHVIEHFSYHTGQITWHTKLLKNKDLGYYSTHDLNRK